MLSTWRRLRIALLSLGALAASVASAQILNSERIEQAFGSYGIDVLYSDETLRLSNLYSEHDGQKVMRTFAIVEYPETVDEAFVVEHRQILAGGSIGSTFKDAGWAVLKTNLFVEEYSITESAPVLADHMGIALGANLATHAYRLDILRSRERFEYALIVEIHHPDYLDQESVRRIYSHDSSGSAEPQVQSSHLTLLRGIAKLQALQLSLSQ